ncbi:alpha-2-macroglobulin family protein [Candidatus Pantoea deserta]|uniref:Alpha-2-macroglobulin n=1 Tax=Candidatus Pantoea deserta TaxID=1869313 RepID=A0A3N4PC95_9GAMM|nr:alpha-2-macroglobulin [Pantoea deserta]RPE02287.1 alpha-2-macroglobulin family protein [Pantoea deserta]
MARAVKRLLRGMLLGAALLSGATGALSAETPAATQQAAKALTIIDFSELQLDGAAALVLTFNTPLDDKQDFAARVKLLDDKSGKVDGGWELAQNGKSLRFRHPEPSRKLTVSVDAGLRAASGATLSAPFSQSLTTRDIQPMVGFASRGSLLPLRLTQGLPVLALNVARVDVDFFRVKNSAMNDFLAQWNYGNNLAYWSSRELLNNADLVYSGRFDLNPARNTREKLQLPLDEVAQLKQPGVYLAVMKQAGTYQYTLPATLFTLSDIGLSLHRFPDEMTLFTQSLASGAPLSDVKVQLLDEKGRTLASGISDSNGYLRLAAQAKGKLLLATQKEQTSLIDLNLPALDLAEFPIAGPQGYDKQLFVFGPRTLYRPGETVIVNALLRDADGKPLPAQPLKAEVVQPNGEVTQTFVWQPENGFYQQRFPLPSSAMTGDWTLRLNSGDSQPRSWTFHVEDFLPERMALRLQNSAAPLSPDADVVFSVEGRYLYGAPAAGNELQGQLMLRPAREAVAALPGYQFGDIMEEDVKRNLDDIDDTLDSDGRLQLTVESEWAQTHSPLNLIFQASLLETGGRPVTRRVAQAIWPAPALPGIRPLFKSESVYDDRYDRYTQQPTVPENSVADFDIVYANSKGDKLAAQDLAVRLIRERRDYYWSFSDSEGWQMRHDEKDLQEDEQRITLEAGQSRKVSFPVEWGSYRLEVQAGDKIVSSVRFRAGYWWEDNTNGTGALRPDQVKLKLDKAAYQPGDTAHIQVESPAAGKGYLMVESSSGTLWWQPISVPAGGLALDVPLDASWKRHDLYLSAIVVRDGDKASGTTPKRAVGLLHLPMATDARRIDLTLDAPLKTRPEQTLKVKVKASAVGGKLPAQIQLLLSAVDSGVLSINDYKTPDPWEGFFGRKRYNADQYDVFGQLIEGGGRLAALRFGGDGEDAGSRGGRKPLTEVNIVAQQLQPVTLDTNGEGTLELPIPQFNGELRLMAQAWSADSFGVAERNVVVAAPLISELATPRFMASGDRALLALDLTNLTDQPQSLKVSVQAQGPIALSGDASHQVNLAKGARATLRIPVKAQGGFGEGAVQVRVAGLAVAGEALPDSQRSWKIGVRPAYPAQTLSVDGEIAAGQNWQVAASAFSGLQPETLSGQLSLSNQPPLNIARYISELYAYPYGCLEQTASGIWPSVFTNHAQLTAMGIKTSSDEARRAAVDTGIARLAGMQRGNGSFGLWSKESEEEFWLTAYVTDFLLRASEAGYSVPQEVIPRAAERLLRYLQDPAQIETRWSSDEEALRFSVQAYAGMVLARQQQAPLGALRALYEKRDKAKSGLALVQLGVALKLMGDPQRAQLALAQGVSLTRHSSDWLGDYGSPLRDRALILSLLAENQLMPELQSALMIDLAKEARGQRWFSTQENNALFLAGRTLQQHQGEVWQASLAGETQSLQGRGLLTLGVSENLLQRGVTLTNNSQTTLYGALNVTGYPLAAPSPMHNVLDITRDYFTLDGKPADLNNLSSGQLLVVRLKVSASKRVSDALVVDLLPAGLELENQNLSDSSASLGDSADALKESMMDMQQADIRHIEFRDDRFVAALALSGYKTETLLYLARAVTPGSYRMPPPQVESMYVPEWRAVGVTPETLSVR